jgi:hypothetical protein
MRWAGHVVYMKVVRNAYRILIGKPERKRPLERLKFSCILKKWCESLS